MPERLNNLSSRQQQYLEATYELETAYGFATTKALAERLGVKMPSVTEAVRRMAGRGLLQRDAARHVRLTRAGRSAARLLDDRHAVLQLFMRDVLGMDPEIAEDEACRIEHATRGEFVDRLAELTRALSAGSLRRCRASLARWREEQRMVE